MTQLLPKLLLCCFTLTATAAEITQHQYQIVERLPHSTHIFTQGLALNNNPNNTPTLWQSSGHYGQSFLQKSNYDGSNIKARFNFPATQFAEGIAVLDNHIYGLTWQQNIAYQWHKETLELIQKFPLEGQGWGLTRWQDQLLMSNGTDQLTWLEPSTFTPVKHINVTRQQQPVTNLNDLTVVNNLIWANVWQQNYLLQIDPINGKVIGQLDLTELVLENTTKNASGNTLNRPEAVLNGIAWDNQKQELLVTGKYWRYLYRIKITTQ